MIDNILLGISFAFAAAVQPGPLQAYLISQTLANGFRRTMPAAFAPIVSDIPIAMLVLLVLTIVPHSFVLALQLIGGSFLLYLAFGAFRSFRDYQEAGSARTSQVHRTFFKAVLVNLLNPNAYIGWGLILGPLVARSWHESPVSGSAVVLAFYATMILTTILILAFFGKAGAAGEKVPRALVGLSVIALASFGLYQIWSGGRELLNLITAHG